MDIKDLKILYFGTPEMSAVVLEKLLQNGYNIIGLVAQIDKPVGRKGIIKNVPTKEVALKYGVPVFQPYKLRNDCDFVKELNPDLILTFAYGQIVPKEVLLAPRYGCLNLHGSLLPKYRGAAPIQYALLNGEKETGVTLMEMVEKMDAGRMFEKVSFPIEEDDNYDTLKAKISNAAFEVFEKGIEDYISKKNLGIEQDESQVTFTHKIENEMTIIDFRDSSINIKNKVRAFANTPGACFYYKNEKIKVLKAEVVNSNIGIPGQIIDYNKDCLKIATQDKLINILILQRPGKKAMSIKEFFNGNRNFFEIADIIKNECIK